MSLLGFSSVCNSCATDYGVEPDEYGSPYATFKVTGTVESKETSESIENIRVIFAKQDTVFTDENGEYVVSSETGFTDEVHISFEDIDSTQNGSYSSVDTTVDFSSSEFTGQDGWYEGTAEEEFNIKLDPEE